MHVLMSMARVLTLQKQHNTRFMPRLMPSNFLYKAAVLHLFSVIIAVTNEAGVTSKAGL